MEENGQQFEIKKEHLIVQKLISDWLNTWKNPNQLALDNKSFYFKGREISLRTWLFEGSVYLKHHKQN